MMATEEITVRVSAEAARAFHQATPEQQLRLETLISLQLLGRLHPEQGLDEIIEDMSQQAQEHGLTPEQLDELLHDDA